MGIANRTGQALEASILGVLCAKRLSVFPQHSLKVKSIFGKTIRVDFWIAPCPALPKGLIVEARWQNVTGSAEEKLPYLVTNIKERYPCPTLIVHDGDGLSPGAKSWLSQQVDGNQLIGVLSIKEFLAWCNRNL